MHYLLFNSGIFVSDGVNTRRTDKEGLQDILGPADEVGVCVVDVDVLIAASVEIPVEKKDSILVRKFTEFYKYESYIIQDEKIGDNLFQVIGIKEQKVKEIYAMVSPQKVRSFIPYGIALRNTLVNHRIDLNKTVVFVDDQGSERLLTVFDGLKFSRTRGLANNGEDLLPEIKRSQIDFAKKNEEYLTQSSSFVIVVNNPSLMMEIRNNDERLTVECLDVASPALEGLKEADTHIKYRLSEEILKQRQELELKKKLKTAAVSICLVIAGAFYFLFNKIEQGLLEHQYDSAVQANERLDRSLNIIDRQTYREDLRRHKSLDYGIYYLAVLDLIPASYEVDSFKFIKSDRWELELDVSSAREEAYDPIAKTGILKRAEIKDIFTNNQPGKYLKVVL